MDFLPISVKVSHLNGLWIHNYFASEANKDAVSLPWGYVQIKTIIHESNTGLKYL